LKAATRIVSLALAAYTAAWFVRVVKGGSTLTDGILPGWEALRVALSPLWPYKWNIDGGLLGLLSVASALTNLIVLALPFWLHLARRHRPAVVIGPLWLATAINAFWMYPTPQDLRWGFYMWFGSFIILAVGLARYAKGLRLAHSSAA